MSLAHLKAPTPPGKRRRPASNPGDPPRPAVVPTGHCGASREPLYRTIIEARESGLMICDACLALSRGRPT
jgi:hypothetical protein